MIKFKPTFIKFYLNVNVGFAKVKIHKIVKLLCLKSWKKKTIMLVSAFGILLTDLSKEFHCLSNKLKLKI